MSPGQTGFVPGTKWVCPRDKRRFSPYFTQWKPSLSLGQTRFVPGTFRGRRAEERVYVLKVYVPFSFPSEGCLQVYICSREGQIETGKKNQNPSSRASAKTPAQNKGFSEGFSEGVFRRGSEKGVSRRCLARPLGEHDPLGVHLIYYG